MINLNTKNRPTNKTFVLEDGTVEILKWLALLFMTLDHFNKYVYSGTVSYFYDLGRLAMPLFSFVFAYNLARPNIDSTITIRVLKRLFVLGLVSSIPYIALGGVQYGWWPLNILFTLFVSGLVIFLMNKGNFYLALILFIFGGAVVEFWWPSIVMTISAYFYFRTLDNKYAFIWLLAISSLYLINQNFWALAALPIIFSSPNIKINFPRWKNAFYFYYPAHLSIIWLMTHNLHDIN